MHLEGRPAQKGLEKLGDGRRQKTEKGAKKKVVSERSIHKQLTYTPFPLFSNTEGSESRYLPPVKKLERYLIK